MVIYILIAAAAFAAISFILFMVLRPKHQNKQQADTMLEALANAAHCQKLVLRNALDNELHDLPKLPNLRWLRLMGEDLHEIPESISQLTHLETLRVEQSGLYLLPESLPQLPQLQEIHLLDNTVLQHFGNFWAQMSALRQLSLSNNGTDLPIPDEIYTLKALEYLNLSNNRLKFIDERIGNLSALKTLILSANFIEKLPDSLSQLHQLKHLDLSGAQITQIDALCGLSGLRHLSLFLCANITETSLHRTLPQLINLESLNLQGSKLQQLPPDLIQITPLQTINLSLLHDLDWHQALSILRKMPSLHTIEAIMLPSDTAQMIRTALPHVKLK